MKNKRHNTDKAEYIFHQILLLEVAQVTVCCNLYVKCIPRKRNKILFTNFVKTKYEWLNKKKGTKYNFIQKISLKIKKSNGNKKKRKTDFGINLDRLVK